jgi:hypothetical protein
MSKVMNKINAEITDKRVLMKEPMTRMSAGIGPIDTMMNYGEGQGFRVFIKWELQGCFSAGAPKHLTTSKVVEHAKRLFVEDVYGEFRAELYEIKHELSYYLDSEKLVAKLEDIMKRMFSTDAQDEDCREGGRG